MNIRVYDPKKDRKAVLRILEEAGWFDNERLQKHREIFNHYFTTGRTLVATVQDTAESLVVSMPGTIRYMHEDLNLCGVTAVATSRIARRQGFATRLTAESIATAAEQGAMVAGLGVFEQGFYEKLGFGAGPYEHHVSFSPASLNIDEKHRPPRRLTADDWKTVHASRMSRRRGHGSCNLIPEIASRFEMVYEPNGFGLGYFDEDGRLTHHLWMSVKGERGPGQVWWMSYKKYDQFLELMALIGSLGEQILSVEMVEPPGIQFQDLLYKPFALRETTRRNRYANYMMSSAYWQLRILDLPGCIERTHLKGDELMFNLELMDPIKKYLKTGSAWQGVDGRFVVRLGGKSSAVAGSEPGIPMLSASVGAFTRLWLGVGSATGLSATDELAGPEELLLRLDDLIMLPVPKVDWEF
jgi:predicted acetyltransferase